MKQASYNLEGRLGGSVDLVGKVIIVKSGRHTVVFIAHTLVPLYVLVPESMRQGAL